MTGPGVKIPITELQTLSDKLKAIVSELTDASSRQNNVEDAVGSPYGDSRLKDRCHDFEGSWNDSRDKLLTKLTEVSSRVEGTIKEWGNLDLELATSMQGSGGNGQNNGAQP